MNDHEQQRYLETARTEGLVFKKRPSDYWDEKWRRSDGQSKVLLDIKREIRNSAPLWYRKTKAGFKKICQRKAKRGWE